MKVGKLLPTKWIKFFFKKIDQENSAGKDTWIMSDLEKNSQKLLDGLHKRINNYSSGLWNMAQSGCKLGNRCVEGNYIFIAVGLRIVWKIGSTEQWEK